MGRRPIAPRKEERTPTNKTIMKSNKWSRKQKRESAAERRQELKDLIEFNEIKDSSSAATSLCKRRTKRKRGKRENEIQSIDGVRTALQLMDEMNGGAAFNYEISGLWAPPLYRAELRCKELHSSPLHQLARFFSFVHFTHTCSPINSINFLVFC